MWLIMNPALPVQTEMMMTCMMCILCNVWCRSVIYSCSLCTISQQVLNSTVMTCFQDRIRNKSLQLRGHNQRVQTEELSGSGTSPAKSPFTHCRESQDVNDEAEEQCWIINMETNMKKRHVEGSQINLQRLLVLHRCSTPSNTMSFGVSI